MKIFDCFLFFNELDLLEIRLNTLYSEVDYFVIVESNRSFSDKEKDYILEKNIKRFEPFLNKIIYFKISEEIQDFSNLIFFDPKTEDDETLNMIYEFINNNSTFNKKLERHWGNDFFHRECIHRPLRKIKPSDDDIIFLSDLDEIPNPDRFSEAINLAKLDFIVCLEQNEFHYYLNYYHNSNWLGTIVFKYGKYKNISLNDLRFSVKRNTGYNPVIIKDGGWHFTSLGSLENIIKKIENWSHQEYNFKFLKNNVKNNIKYGFDIFGRRKFGLLYFVNPTDINLLPKYVTTNFSKYKNLIGAEFKKVNLLTSLKYKLFCIIVKIYTYIKINKNAGFK